MAVLACLIAIVNFARYKTRGDSAIAMGIAGLALAGAILLFASQGLSFGVFALAAVMVVALVADVAIRLRNGGGTK